MPDAIEVALCAHVYVHAAKCTFNIEYIILESRKKAFVTPINVRDQQVPSHCVDHAERRSITRVVVPATQNTTPTTTNKRISALSTPHNVHVHARIYEFKSAPPQEQTKNLLANEIEDAKTKKNPQTENDCIHQ